MTDAVAATGEVRYAGFWRRVLAYIVDFAVLMLFSWIVHAILGIPMFDVEYYTTGSAEEVAAAMEQSYSASIINLLVGWLYFAGSETWGPQGTLGKLVLGVKVTDLRGGRIGFGRASIRYWGKLISLIILGIGFLMVAFTARKQGLHDMMAGCLVVKK